MLRGALLALVIARGGAATAAPVAATAAPITWQLCPDAEAGALVPLPAAAGTPAAILRLSRPLSGFRLTAGLVHGSKDGDLVLVGLTASSGARPGRYDGVLTVRRGQTVSRRRAAIEVLPFALLRPSKQYAVSRVPVRAGECCAPEAADVAGLRRLRAIGIGALCLNAAPADRSALESVMQAAGLHGPVLAPAASSAGLPGAGGPAPQVAASTPALPPVLTPPSHPARSGPPIRWYAWFAGGLPAPETMAALKASGARVACRLDEPAAANGVDLPVFDASGASSARLLHSDRPPGARAAGWWRWEAGTAAALENRLRCGALLWKSGLSGALVEISPDAPASPDWPRRWEGIRQGVLDSRYLTTLFALIRQVKDKDRANPAPGKAEVAIAAALNGVVEHPSPEAADRLRSLVIAWILKLGRMV